MPHLPRVTLEIVRGKARRLLRRVSPPVFVIGSAADCDLVLADERFPEAYAYVYVTSRGVTLRHLGAPPELLVNGCVVQSAMLDDGDRLAMGDYEFQINITVEDPRGGGIRAHDPDAETIPFDVLCLETPAGRVRALLAEIRSAMNLRPIDLKIFAATSQPEPAAKRPSTRPLAGFVSRRASA